MLTLNPIIGKRGSSDCLSDTLLVSSSSIAPSQSGFSLHLEQSMLDSGQLVEETGGLAEVAYLIS